MKKFFLLCTFGVCFNLYAGNGTSGGGGAFVCRDLNNNITSSYLLDLWEAEKIRNQEILYSNESPDLQIKNAIEKLYKIDSDLAINTEQQVELIFKSARYLPDDIALPAPADANSRYQKKNCPLEGMMFYDGSLDQLQIVPSVFTKLATNTDIAAAKIHEAIYYVYRNELIKKTISITPNSIPIRKLVGCLFSKDDSCILHPNSKYEIISSSNEQVYCESENFSYYLIKQNPFIVRAGQLVGFENTNNSWLGVLDKFYKKNITNLTFFNVGPENDLVQSSLMNSMNKYSMEYYPLLFERKSNDSLGDFPVLTRLSTYEIMNEDREKFEKPTCKKLK